MDFLCSEEIVIEDLDPFGNGKAEVAGRPAFIPGGLPGEKIRPVAIVPKPTYMVVTEYVQLSVHPERREAPCAYFSRCGGCQIQHLSTKGQLTFKEKHLGKILQSGEYTGNISLTDFLPTAEWGFRSKMIYYVKHRGQLGYFASRSHTLVAHDICLTDYPGVTIVKKLLERWLADQKTPLGTEGHGVRAIALRFNQNGDFLVTIIATSPPQNAELLKELLLSQVGFTGLLWHINTKSGNSLLDLSGQTILVYGTDNIVEKIDGIAYHIGALDFFQTNPPGARLLVSLVRELAEAKGSEQVIDLFGGVGLFGLALARCVARVVSVESNVHAVRQAQKNALSNNIRNFEAVAVSSEDFMNQISGQVDILVADPPRRGLGDKLTEKITLLKPEKIIYVSCNPHSWQQDATYLLQHGYTCDRLYGVDMFPQTLHYELVSRFRLR